MSARLYTKKVYWKMRLGFTLIELLVTISIISMLSSVVMATVSSARSKATDARIKSQLRSAKTAAELYLYNSSTFKYGNAVGGTEPAGTTVGGGCANGLFTNSIIKPLVLSANYPVYSAGAGRCTVPSSGDSYTISVKLSNGQFWCVDGKGNATTLGTLQAEYGDSCFAVSGGGASMS